MAALLVGSAVIASSGRAAAETPRPADSRPAASRPGVHYAVTEPACPAGQPGYAECDAVERVPVPKGTPDAKPYTVGPETGLYGLAGGFTPDALLTAYGLSGLPASAGSGQTVGVVDAFDDPNALSDLNTFDAEYGLPAETASTFVKLNQDGATNPLPSVDPSSNWPYEESLDLDSVRGLCHKCKIVLVETDDNSNDNLAAGVNAAVAAGANEVSNSYGGPGDPSPGSTDAQAYNHPGVVITASTGDNGWADWGSGGNGGYADFPASSPDVVAVGGTSLLLNPNGTRNVEAVWNEYGPENSSPYVDATGGGCSRLYAAQPWQAGVAGYADTGCGAFRLDADVAALADPFTGYDIYDSYADADGDPTGWSTSGGTSLASPLVAAMWALAGGANGVAYPSQTLYSHANSPSFFDVTQGYDVGSGVLAHGGNDYCDGDSAAVCDPTSDVSCLVNGSGMVLTDITQCTAAVGYDGPSGLGAPNGLSGFLPSGPSPTFTAPTNTFAGVPQAFSGSATDSSPGATITSYVWSWGDGSATSPGASASHTFAATGVYNVTLTVTDSNGQVGSVTHGVNVFPTPLIATSIAMASSANPSVFGQPVTLTATVSPSAGGSLQWYVDGAPIGSPTGLSSTIALPAGESVGSHVVAAAYSGDPTHAQSWAQMVQVVGKAATDLTVAAGDGQLTATVAPIAPGAGVPTGTVTFSVAGVNVGTAPLSGGVASVPASREPAARHGADSPGQAVSAVYSGDPSFSGSSASTTATNPTITATVASADPEHNGWYRKPVTITYHCTVGSAPLTASCPSPDTLFSSGAAQFVTQTITDTLGGVSTVVVSPINIDRSGPTLKVVRAGSGRSLRCVAHDALSGVATCTIRQEVASSSHGVTTVVYFAKATDVAGNLTRLNGSYTVS